MTEKQKQRVNEKIKAIRGALAEERRKFGGYHDGRGLRYSPPGLYLKIQDYKGAMTYFRWFAKNFPDDVGGVVLLFEWSIVLFKTGKLKEAEQKAIESFCFNTYVFDRFFGLEIEPEQEHGHTGVYQPDYAEYLPYSEVQEELQDFAAWLSAFLSSDRFKAIEQEYISLKQQLPSERPGPARDAILQRMRELAAS